MANVKLEDAQRFVVQAQADRVQAAIKKVQEVVLTRGPQYALQEVANTNPSPVDRGSYRQGFKFLRLPDGAAIVNTTPYAGVIEGGRRPGARQPPKSAIEGWLQRKGIAKGNDAKRMAYVVARAIGKRGLPAKRVIQRAATRLLKDVQDALARIGE